MYYGKQFGIVPVPVRVAGQHVIVPLGGEDWMVGKTGGSAAQQMAFDYIEGMQTPSKELQLAKLFGYLPAKDAVAKTYVNRPALSGACTPTRRFTLIRVRWAWGEVPEDLLGSVDGHPGCTIGFTIGAIRTEHGAVLYQHRLEELTPESHQALLDVFGPPRDWLVTLDLWAVAQTVPLGRDQKLKALPVAGCNAQLRRATFGARIPVVAGGLREVISGHTVVRFPGSAKGLAGGR